MRTQPAHAGIHTYITTCTGKAGNKGQALPPSVFIKEKSDQNQLPITPWKVINIFTRGEKGKWGHREAGITGATALHAEDLGWGWVRRGKTLGRGGSEMKTGWKLSIGDGGWGMGAHRVH